MTVNRTSMNGWYKTRYGEKNDLVPEYAILQQDFPFSKRGKTGASFKEPVRLRQAHGVTFKGGSNIADVYDLQDPITAQWAEMDIKGSEIILRDQIGYGAIAAAMGGDVSYGDVVDETVLGLDNSHRMYVEAAMLYGQSSIATVESVSGSGTSRVWTIAKASWAPGLWSGGENMRLDAYQTVAGTKRNTTAAVQVTGIDPDLRQVSVSGDATDLGNVIGGDVLVFRLAEGELMAGIDKALTNTGTLHGISAATYNLWKGNVHDAGGSALTMGILHAATIKAVVRGLRGALTWYVNTYSWQNLVDNENSLRRYAESTKSEYETGAESVSFRSANGKMTIKHHAMIKAGEAFGLEPTAWRRSGESDLTEDVGSPENPNFFHEIPNKSGREYRNFSSQYFLCRRPSRQVKIKNIVPSGLA